MGRRRHRLRYGPHEDDFNRPDIRDASCNASRHHHPRQRSQDRLLRRAGLQWPRFITQNTIWPLLEQRLTPVSNLPFEFVLPDGDVVGLAFRAGLLLNICDAWIDAAVAGETREQQGPMVAAAIRISRGLSEVGLTALIDEATGFQEQREPGDLQALLLRLVQAERTEWKRRFDAEFFIELYRLYNLPGDPRASRRPGCVAGMINFLVYDRMFPKLRPYIEARNPSDGKGQRRWKHHQYLSEIGRLALRKHLDIVMRLMKASRSKHQFEEFLAVVFPREHEQLTLGVELALYEHLMGDESDGAPAHGG